ncbi:MAG: M14 family zinc carboxypeptidase, partial [Candidatus Latescibacterota bacterium]
RKVADPRLIQSADEERRLLAEGKAVLIINCSIHSSEIAATQMSLELLHDLASGDSPEIKEILANTIVLLIPSASPDGLEMVIDWYERSLGKPWEGSGMPWLYHKYAGHDNNRDWFMLNLQETKLSTKVLYSEWFPHIVYDIHQMGSAGPRYFVPPFFDPKSPNIDPLTEHLILVTGGHMAAELTRAGKRGVVHSAMYDNWWQGGFRSTVYRHNMVGLLTEAASVRIASPIFQGKNELQGGIRGLDNYTMTVNFPDPWPGGWWRLRDIVEYEKISCLSLFTLAARYRELFLSNTIKLAREAMEKGKSEPPFAWLVPPDQRDPGAALRMLQILRDTGIEVHRSDEAFTADGVPYPAGTYVLYCAQPYRAHLNDMMEPQNYPDRLRYPGGPPEPPYDIAGWTLPLQMGVRRVAAVQPFQCKTHMPDRIEPQAVDISGKGGNFIVRACSNDDFRLANRLHRAGIAFKTIPAGVNFRDGSGAAVPAGSFFISGNNKTAKELPKLLEGLSCSVVRAGNLDAKTAPALRAAKPPRTALYQSWTANADEGWTRLVLEQFEFGFATLHDTGVRAGNLRERYDCIILPSAGEGGMLSGNAPDATEPQYTGGLGNDGLIALQRFVEEGGTLVCIDEACSLPISRFHIPVRNILTGKKAEEFYCPGSILRVHLEGESALGYGLPEWISGYFSRSQAFETVAADPKADPAAKEYTATVAARYGDNALLESGWIRGESVIAGKPAIVEVGYGKGNIVLLGFRVQYRAQSCGSYRLLFNAIQGM